MPAIFIKSSLFYDASEKLFMSMADHLAADGFRDAGYQYVNIDVSLRNFHAVLDTVEPRALWIKK